MKESNELKAIGLGLLGAVVGGCLGYFAFFWIVKQGFYALVLPPGLLGYGAGVCAGRRSVVLAGICGAAGLALGLFIEWRFAPFAADGSLAHFLTHVTSLTAVTLFMLASAVDLVIQLARLKGGARKIMKITEIRGRKGNRYVVRDLFGFRQTGVQDGLAVGEFYATGHVPRFLERLRTSGLEIEDTLFAERVLAPAEPPPVEACEVDSEEHRGDYVG